MVYIYDTRRCRWKSIEQVFILILYLSMVKVKPSYEPSGPSGRSLSQFPQHEATRNISTPPCMGCQSIAGLPPALNSPLPIYNYTWAERGNMKVKCSAQEHNTMSLARARSRTARCGDQRTNHEANAYLSITARENICCMNVGRKTRALLSCKKHKMITIQCLEAIVKTGKAFCGQCQSPR